MIPLNQFVIKKVSEEGNKADFEIGPLPKGYGVTLGTTLRRVLYSSIPGSSITGIKIDGVSHEYSTLSGVSDDILKVLLSVKNVVVKSKSDEPVTLELEVKGKKSQVTEVKASDIKAVSEVEIINKDYVITTLTSDKSFKATLVVERNVGYSFANEELRKELGMLPIDANFSPVKLVNYAVTPTRVGQETELDQINLSVLTDGSMQAVDALSMAASILNELVSHLVETANSISTGETLTLTNPLKAKKVEKAEEQKSVKVADLGLSTRLTNALLRSGYDDLVKLEGFTEEELANIRGMGEKSLEELIKILKKHNINVI